jgi:hypothetical protein
MLYNLAQSLKSQNLLAQISSEGQNTEFLASRMFIFDEVHKLYTIRSLSQNVTLESRDVADCGCGLPYVQLISAKDQRTHRENVFTSSFTNGVLTGSQRI